MAANRQSQWSVKHLVVPPGQSLDVHVTGRCFFTLEANLVFRLQFQNGETADSMAGLGYEFRPGEYFTQFTVFNLSADTTLDATIITGSEPVDNRSLLVKTKPEVQLLAQAPTYVVPSSTTLLAPGESQVLSGQAVIVS